MTADDPRLADVSRTLEAHSADLLALPGVVGVAVGLAADGETPCLLVLVRARTPALDAALPRTLEGHPVVVEVSGTIRPFEAR